MAFVARFPGNLYLRRGRNYIRCLVKDINDATVWSKANHVKCAVRQALKSQDVSLPGDSTVDIVPVVVQQTFQEVTIIYDPRSKKK